VIKKTVLHQEEKKKGWNYKDVPPYFRKQLLHVKLRSVVVMITGHAL
jgi:hypothetical protein